MLALCAVGALADHPADPYPVRSLSIRGISDTLSLINARDCGRPAVDLFRLGIKCVLHRSPSTVSHLSTPSYYRYSRSLQYGVIGRARTASLSPKFVFRCRHIPNHVMTSFLCSIVVGVSAYGRAIDLQPINLCNQTACPLELTKDFSGRSIWIPVSVLEAMTGNG